MPVTVFVGQIPAVAADGFLAFLTGVGVQTFIALHTVWVVLTQNIFITKQRLLTIVTVIALGHLHFNL